MSNLYDATPSSLRKPMETSRFAHNLAVRSLRPLPMIVGPERAVVLTKNRFSRMPQEPEDARMTGVTRSLQRRLLALNMTGTRTMLETLMQSKIA
jgi:hypothetical protein